MNIKKMVTIGMIIFLGFISNVYAIYTTTFKETTNTARHTNVLEGNISILDLISFVNSYIWFAIGFFCFVFMIWNGYKLIMANGDGKSMESAKKALLGCAIGLAVCLLAYIIVNLAVKLFA